MSSASPRNGGNNPWEVPFPVGINASQTYLVLRLHGCLHIINMSVVACFFLYFLLCEHKCVFSFHPKTDNIKERAVNFISVPEDLRK